MTDFTVRPSKSAAFVIHKLEEWRRAQGDGISVRIDGKPIEDIVFEDGAVNIRSGIEKQGINQ
jgi:hypothetical protein